MNKVLREFHLIFVAPDGTEYPVRGTCLCNNDGAEWLVDQLQSCADALGLTLNCGIVEVQEPKMLVCNHAPICNVEPGIIICGHSRPHRSPVCAHLKCGLHSDARCVEMQKAADGPKLSEPAAVQCSDATKGDCTASWCNHLKPHIQNDGCARPCADFPGTGAACVEVEHGTPTDA